MELEIRNRFNDGILREAMRRYAIPADRIRLLDGFESFIYEFDRNDGAYILRIGHSLRRTVELIQGEVDWINYLAAGGAGVARAILSENGVLVECIDDGQGGQFLATAFVKAAGGPPSAWTPALYERYGELIGRLHALSRTYNPSNPAWRRPAWDAPGQLEPERWLPSSEAVALQKYRQLKTYLDCLPRDAGSYGLIHQDAHTGNLFVDDTGRFTLFDFDDCVYGWYIYDIAMVVFYMIVNADDPVARTGEFLPAFWHGYCRENQLDRAWLKEIPPFMKLREIDLYAILHRSFGDFDAIENPWIRRFLKGRKARIEGDVPVATFDFEGSGR
ncbi:MAG TPA: phosphotransferase [Aggregatilineales bacterium]|nr:phosphotransferase [Aggregatilineales bacterium]